MSYTKLRYDTILYNMGGVHIAVNGSSGRYNVVYSK